MYTDDGGTDDNENENISKTKYHHFFKTRTIIKETDARYRCSAIINL